jgi:4-azaleucine resistance transporter AzlC
MPENAPAPPFTRAGFAEGLKLCLPLLPGVVVFGIAVGAAAAQKGLSLAELTAMNALVYAGASQLVALGLWRESWTVPALLSIALVTLTVNARLLLMSAALRANFGDHPPRWTYPALLVLTDANYIVMQRYRDGAGRDLGVFLGVGLLLWLVWILAPLPGFLAGRLVADPRAFGLDLVMPVVFTAMVARLWQGRRDTFAWLAAGATGYAVHRAFGGAIHVVLGALAGMAVAALLARPAREAAR